MKNIILYHGSTKVIERPMLGFGNPKNDYGLGFYCTENLELAKEWASTEQNNGFANRYELDLDELTIFHLNEKPYHILNWLSILLKNRTFVLSQGLPFEASSASSLLTGKESSFSRRSPSSREYSSLTTFTGLPVGT